MESLRKSLQDLKELRDLVRSLGRGSAVKGPLRRAPRQVEQSGAPQGVVRSPHSPSETRGLTRSDDLSRMLPSEAQILAAGKDIPAARMLHFARRAERNLLSYERSGWLEDAARTLERTEIRPTSERGPIILCLDTSGCAPGRARGGACHDGAAVSPSLSLPRAAARSFFRPSGPCGARGRWSPRPSRWNVSGPRTARTVPGMCTRSAGPAM